jgi:hypothetical protein
MNHSPDGFQWGYGGSGPAQLALGILAHYFATMHPQPVADRMALGAYQQFKFRALAGITADTFALAAEHIEAALLADGFDEQAEALAARRIIEEDRMLEAGIMPNDAEDPQRWEVVRRMEEHGGSFVKALAGAFRYADPHNFRRLRASFLKYWNDYADQAPALPEVQPRVANSFLVGALGDRVAIVGLGTLNLSAAHGGITEADALNLAAWLVAVAPSEDARERFDAVLAAILATYCSAIDAGGRPRSRS